MNQILSTGLSHYLGFSTLNSIACTSLPSSSLPSIANLGRLLHSCLAKLLLIEEIIASERHLKVAACF